MTIISPTKKKQLKGFFIKIFLIIVAGAFMWIYQYNALAETKFQIEDLETKIVEMEVENAELKNELYKITDPSHLEKVATTEGLVLDENPKYLNLNQWVSDSSY